MNHPQGWRYPKMRFEKFTELYARAIAQGITLRPDPEYPDLFALATSGTRKNTEYRVNEFMCACEAGVHSMDCKHRALYLMEHIGRIGKPFFTHAEEESWETDDESMAS